MKKLYLASFLLLGALPMLAQPAPASQNHPGKKSYQDLPTNITCSGIPNTRAEEEGPIYVAPSGDKVYYDRISDGYYYGFSSLSFGHREGGISIVYGDDGFVYIHNPVSGYGMGTYLKGRIIDNEIEVELPQVIDIQPDYDNINQNRTFYVAIMDCVEADADYATYEVVEDNAIFRKNLDGSISFALVDESDLNNSLFGASRIMGICDEYGNLFAGDAIQTLTPTEVNPVIPPTDLVTEDWLFYAYYESHNVKIGWDGDDVYLWNFDYVYTPNKWIKGKMIDDTHISFPSCQFLEETGGFFYNFMAANYNGGVYEVLPEIILTYDREKSLITTEPGDCMVSNPVTSSVSYDYPDFMDYLDPVIKFETGETLSYVPQNPLFVAYIPSEYDETIYCEFDIFDTSILYDTLDKNNLYFRLFVNGNIVQPSTNEPGDYNFPYGFWGYGDDFIQIMQLGTNVVMYLYDKCNLISMQMLYDAPDGVTYESDLVTYSVVTDEVFTTPSAGVEEIGSADVIGSEIYDLKGIKHSSLQKGINIIRNRHTDGKVSVRKILVK